MAPAGLLAELTVREPAGLYASLRALIPGQGSAAPTNPALALAAAGDLPLVVANALVLERPCHGAVVSAGGSSTVSAVACHVRSGPELVQALSAGTSAARRAVLDAATGLTVLTSTTAPPLGVVDDFLVASTDEATLRAVGPYLARALPRRALPSESVVVEVPTSALKGALDRVVRARWQRARDGLAVLAKQAAAAEGRPPDFGDPELILSFANERVLTLLELLQSSDRVRLAFTPGAAGLDLRLALTPTPGGAAERATRALVVGSLQPLLSLPRTTVGAGYFHFTAADCPCGQDEPARPASNLAATTAVDVAKQALGSAFRTVLEESDGATFVGLGLDRSLVLRRQTRAASASERALAALFRAAREPTLARALEPVLGKVLVREDRTTPKGFPGGAQRAELTVPGLGLNRAEVAWATHDDVLWVAAGGETGKVLTAAVAAPNADRLGAESATGSLLARHEPAAFALLVNSGALPPGLPEPPSLLSFTRRDDSAVLELDLAEADAKRLMKVFLR